MTVKSSPTVIPQNAHTLKSIQPKHFRALDKLISVAAYLMDDYGWSEDASAQLFAGCRVLEGVA